MLNRWYDTGLPRDLFQSLFDDDLFRFDRRLQTLWDRAQSTNAPSFTVHDDGQKVVVKSELPGLRREELTLTAENGSITISGQRALEAPEGYRALRRERLPLKFTRTISFPKDLNLEAAEAKLEDGVLTLQIPRRAEAAPRQIPVKEASHD
jgi:HSP20 family protein